MKREELKALGLTEEQINEVMKVNGADIEKYKGLSETQSTELETIKTQIKERDTQLETLKKSTGDTESLKAQIIALQEANTTAVKDYETKLKDSKISNAIKLAIAGKVHDEDMVAGLFKKDNLILGEDGKLLGLDDQLKTIKASKAFLFKEDKQPEPPAGFKFGLPPAPASGADALNSQLMSAFGLPQAK